MKARIHPLRKPVRAEGLRVPGDLEVIGFDDVPLAALVQPSLSTVHQPVIEKGKVAARRLAVDDIAAVCALYPPDSSPESSLDAPDASGSRPMPEVVWLHTSRVHNCNSYYVLSTYYVHIL